MKNHIGMKQLGSKPRSLRDAHTRRMRSIEETSSCLGLVVDVFALAKMIRRVWGAQRALEAKDT
jgi:hypothetical protein